MKLVMPLQTNHGFTNRVIELTNQERSKAGLQALKFERRLTTAAQRHSQDMALQDYFSHKQLNGGTLGDRIKATGYQWSSYERLTPSYQGLPIMVKADQNLGCDRF